MERLTGLKIPATGVGFGFDRTVEAADQLNLIPNLNSSSQVLMSIFDKKYQDQVLETAKKLRQANIKTELYPDNTDKIGKQFKYADKKNIPYVIIIGEEEAKNNQVSLKNLETGDQEMMSVEDVVAKLA